MIILKIQKNKIKIINNLNTMTRYNCRIQKKTKKEAKQIL